MLRYAITEGRLRGSGDEKLTRALVEHCAELATAGVDFLLVREKALDVGALVGLCRRVKAVGRGARVLVSGRADVALAAGLDGIHLSARTGELTPGQVRDVMAGAWVSVSCHSVDEVLRAREGVADAVLFGPVFGKAVDGTEVMAGIGLARLAEACAAAGPMPVLALGGVCAENVQACGQAGASGVAGIRLFQQD